MTRNIIIEMLKRNPKISREFGGRRVLPEDEIWQNARDVWKELPNSKVASAYVQAYRIADKVFQAKGDNKFLGSGGSIHCGIGNDFKFIENGIERKD
jgi:ABC-type branched-subunit amino acid transport system substrate-binding protein